MKRLLFLTAVMLCIAIPVLAQNKAPGAPDAAAAILDAKGQKIGSATFNQSAGSIKVMVHVMGLPTGLHGMHIHAVGKCEPPDFQSAGGHFNPGGKQHGLQNPAGPHAGDLPNLEVTAEGMGMASFLLSGVTLGPGPTSLFQEGGTALVIHAGPDDELTDPAGNSGARIACGVIVK